MFMFSLIVLLLLASVTIPWLLLIAIPLTWISIRNILRKRRAILDLVDNVEAERANDRMVRYFR